MSGGPWDDVAVSLLGAALKLAPSIGELIASGVAAKPEHPLAPKILAMLPERNASREALHQLDSTIPPTEPGSQ